MCNFNPMINFDNNNIIDNVIIIKMFTHKEYMLCLLVNNNNSKFV